MPPFFGALHALAIDDAGGGASFSFRLLAAFNVERMMNAIQRAVAMPPNEVVVHRAARRKVFWKVAPLAAGRQEFGGLKIEQVKRLKDLELENNRLRKQSPI